MTGQHRADADMRPAMRGWLAALVLGAVAAVVAVAVTACGSAPQPSAAAYTPAPPVQATPPCDTTGQPSPAGCALTTEQMRQECAALALVRSGIGTYAEQVAVMAGQYTVDQSAAAVLIRQAVQGYCPALVSVLP